MTYRTVTSQDIADHAGLIHHVLNNLTREDKLSGELEREDLEAVGMWATWEALRRYDPTKGAKASTYVADYIRGYIQHYQRDTTKATGWHRILGRLGHVTSYEQALEDHQIQDTPATDNTEAEALWNVTQHDIRATITQLPLEQQPAALALLEDRPVLHLANQLGVNRQTANRHRQRAYASIAHLVER